MTRRTRNIVSFRYRDAGLHDGIVFPVYRVSPNSGASEANMAYMSLMETMLSIFLIPSQCNTSGINAWKRISFTPAMSSVDLKYLSAESPPRLRRLYTRYLTDPSQMGVASGIDRPTW